MSDPLGGKPEPVDGALDRVYEEVASRAEPARETFGRVIRRAIDEVLDGPRTGRFDFYQLEKTEKTYVGTKLEILLRSALRYERGPSRDLEIAGEPVDIKWAMNSVWMIPPESKNEVILCIGGRQRLTEFQVGLVRCRPEYVNWATGQRDKKGSLTAEGRAALRPLVQPAPLPQNAVAQMDPEIRAAAMAEGTIQRRVTKLFEQMSHQPLPRDAIRTIARTEGDPMRRLRQDQHAGDPLDGWIVLSYQDGGNTILEALGYERLSREEFMAIERAELESVPEPVRAKLPSTARRRFGL